MRALWAIGLLLAACSAPGGAGVEPSRSTPASAAVPEIGGPWQLVSWRAEDHQVLLPPDWPITLTVAADAFSGTVCNHYGARFVVEGGGVRVVELSGTDMACVEPRGIMELERAYLEALATTRRIVLDGDTLVLEGDAVALRYGRLPEPPTEELVDVEWVLAELVRDGIAAPPAGERATLTLRSDGTFDGSTGCRSFSGRWLEDGHEILAPTWGMDGVVECPPELQAQDGHVVTVIGDGFVPTVDDGRLVLTDPGGDALVYRPAE